MEMEMEGETEMEANSLLPSGNTEFTSEREVPIEKDIQEDLPDENEALSPEGVKVPQEERIVNPIPETDTDICLCACCAKQLTIKSASDIEDEAEPVIKIEVDLNVELNPDDPDSLGGDTSIPKPPVADILATIFEYPYVARREKSVFRNEKYDYDLCSNCDRLLNRLFPMYQKFVDILDHQGLIWKTLLKVGDEPILPMLIYEEGEDGSRGSNLSHNQNSQSNYSNSNNVDNTHYDDDFHHEDPYFDDEYQYKPKKARRPRKTTTPKRLSSTATNTKNKGSDASSCRRVLTNVDDDVDDDIEESDNKALKTEILEVSKSGRPLRRRIQKFSISDDDESYRAEDTEDEDFYLSDDDGGGMSDGPAEIDIADDIDGTANENESGTEAKELNEESSAKKDMPKKRRARRAKTESTGKRKKKLKASSKSTRTTAKSKLKSKPMKKVKTGTESKTDDDENEDKDTEPKPKKKDVRKRIRPNRRKENWLHLAKGDPKRTCPVCGKLFFYPRFMEHHRITVHEGKKPYECKSCGKGFTQKFILKKHKCDYSQVTDADRDFLKLAREEQLRCFQCDVCGKKFKERCHLNNHKLNHSEDRPFQCEKCAKCFRRRDHLRMHIRVVHNNERKFVCTLCGKTFKIMSNLRAHERRHNFPDEKHLCPICGKSFDTISLVNRHQMTHDEVLPFQCDICGKRFKMKDYLGQHLRKGKSCKPGMQPRVKGSSGKNSSATASSSADIDDGDVGAGSGSGSGMESMDNLPHSSSSSFNLSSSGNLANQASTSGHQNPNQGPFTLAENLMGAHSHHLPHDFPLPFPYSQLFENRSLTEL